MNRPMKSILLLISIINLNNIYAAASATTGLIDIPHLQSLCNTFSNNFNQIVAAANGHNDDYKNHIRYCYRTTTYWVNYPDLMSYINQTINGLSSETSFDDLSWLAEILNQMKGVVTCIAKESTRYDRASSGETNFSSMASQMLQDFNSILQLTYSWMNMTALNN